MVKIVDIPTVNQLVSKVGLIPFIDLLVKELEQDFSRWNEFQKSPRHATHYPEGVIELMPVSDNEHYGFKYVNGHPINTHRGKICITGVGMLAEVLTGFPLMISEMTVLTAIRTAATSMMAAKYMANPNSEVHGMIGTGAQSEFQALAMCHQFPIKKVIYHDIDPAAEEKLIHNHKNLGVEFERCDDLAKLVAQADIVTTCTAAKCKQELITAEMLHPGLHLNAIGGDCPGKTELDPNVIPKANVVVELTEQTLIEGELQHHTKEEVFAELWEVITQQKQPRQNADDITLFDSVGFALEDYSTLKLVYRLCQEHNLGFDSNLLPDIDDPKNLFGILDRCSILK